MHHYGVPVSSSHQETRAAPCDQAQAALFHWEQKAEHKNPDFSLQPLLGNQATTDGLQR